MHNATLMHNDVQDGDAIHRGQPMVWRHHGLAQAIIVSNLMLMVPYQLITLSPFNMTTAS